AWTTGRWKKTSRKKFLHFGKTSRPKRSANVRTSTVTGMIFIVCLALRQQALTMMQTRMLFVRSKAWNNGTRGTRCFYEYVHDLRCVGKRVGAESKQQRLAGCYV